MSSEQSPFAGAPGMPRNPEVPGTSRPAPGEPAPGEPAPGEPTAGLDAGSLPVMPGFREMALRRRADEQTARMAEDRGRLVRELAEQRQAAGLSQTEGAARMGTSPSAVGPLASRPGD